VFNTAGPNAQIARQVARQAQVTVGTSAGASTGLDTRHAAGQQMIVPAGVTSQTVAVYVSDSMEGTYVPLNDADGPVTFDVAASNAYDLPEACYGNHFTKFVGTAAFTAVVLAKG
jgi:hypothetical protein